MSKTSVNMTQNNRRDFLRKSVLSAGGLFVNSTILNATKKLSRDSANERINVAVVGINGKGKHHYNRFSQIPNVRVTTLCDVDERLFPRGIADVEKLSGFKPKTEVDIRRVLEDKNIDAISVATPDHWHALMTIWACQAGKDVYVEKPVSFTVQEGRKMVEASRKYDRIVQAGMNMRSEPAVNAAMQFLNQGRLGEIYMAKGVCFKPRNRKRPVNDSDKHSIGCLYELLQATHRMLNPPGEWNNGRIISRGTTVQHWLNGTMILEYERGGKAFREAVSNSKFRDYPNFGEALKGHILLQDHSDRTYFRNIKIRELCK